METDLVGNFLKVIATEAHSLQSFLNNFRSEDAVYRAVSQMAGATGIIACIGIGKSGHIARKASATFASLSIRSFFLHATELMHGDMGNLASGDVAILFSNSGETQELLDILPALRARNIYTIGVVGRKTSRLGQNVDTCIEACVNREACHLNLAPTASTTLALSIADGLGVATAFARGITQSSFAANHPSGRLGRQLTLKVSDVMVPLAGCAFVRQSHTLKEVVIAITEKHTNCAPVVDEDLKLVGIVTDGDIRRALLKSGDYAPLAKLVGQIMTIRPFFVNRESLAYAAKKSFPNGLDVAPVVGNDGVFCGVLYLKNIN